MISVLTLTYQRHYLLKEAIESFLRQDFSGESEMLIINDCYKVEYVFEIITCNKIIKALTNYRQSKKPLTVMVKGFLNGDPSTIRTRDTLIKSHCINCLLAINVY